MELLQPADRSPAPVTIDWSRPVVDFDALEWPFGKNTIGLCHSVLYIDSSGNLSDAGTPVSPFALDQHGDDTILGHLTDGRMFVSSREGITAFEAKQ